MRPADRKANRVRVFGRLHGDIVPYAILVMEADLVKRFTCYARSRPVASGICHRGRFNYLALPRCNNLIYERPATQILLAVPLKSGSSTIIYEKEFDSCTA